MKADKATLVPKKHLQVGLIGRPNVGKSTLFNLLTKSRQALVKDRPGVTRDLQIKTVEMWGAHFEVVDSGGFTENLGNFTKEIREGVESLISQADILIFILDGRTGLMSDDQTLAERVRVSQKPALFVINKVDQFQDDDLIRCDFSSIGFDTMTASFEQYRGVAEIVEWILTHTPSTADTNPVIDDRPEKGPIRIAVVGKPNVGKSSLCNRLIGKNRVLVSDIAGTTVDTIEIPFQFQSQNFLLVDTAGLRRRAKRTDDLEALSAYKVKDAIATADIVFLVLDGTDNISEQDARVLSEVLSSHKAVITVVNKSDLAMNQKVSFRKGFREQLSRTFHFFPDVPVVFVSARTGQGLIPLLRMSQTIWGKLHIKIPTSELNHFFMNTIRLAPAPKWGVRDVKLYYLTQTKQRPPAFIAFVNFPGGITTAYRRFLCKRICERWDLKGIPVRIFAMKKGRKLDHRINSR